MFDFFKREFMLGVGAGLIISGILVSLAGNGRISDEEVITRAAKLGMVQKQAASQGQPEAKKPEPRPETGKAEPGKTDQAVTWPSAENSSAEKSAEVKSSSFEKPGFVTIEVKPGMGSETVIRILEQKGVISDGEEFYKVMTKYDAHSRVKVGIFKIPDGTGMKGIVDILTGKDE